MIIRYALTISRSQGLTTDRVIVEFSVLLWCADDIVYVALFRDRWRADLKVIAMTRGHAETDSKSLKFEQSLAFF